VKPRFSILLGIIISVFFNSLSVVGNMVSPYLMVSDTFVWSIVSGSTAVRSTDRITRSASSPTSIEPLVFSSKC